MDKETKPSCEEVLRIAKEYGAFIDVLYAGRHDNRVFTSGELERFAAAMYAKGAEDMRERVEISAKKEVSDWEILRDISISRKESAVIESTNILAINRLVDAIRALPITPTNTEGEQG